MNSASLLDARSILNIYLIYISEINILKPNFKTHTIYNQSKQMKNLDINLTKQRKDLYAKNYKIPIKEIKQDLNQ